MSRRPRPFSLVLCTFFTAIILAPGLRADVGKVDMAYVSELARKRAEAPFKSPKENLPEALGADQLNYDNYREIRFKPDMALWKAEGQKFQVQFFHPGYIYHEPVQLNEFTATHLQRIRFAMDFFDYGSLDLRGKVPADTGYAGFRLHYPVNNPGVMDEVAVFQGASYFRFLAKGLRYGLSGRGLALDCGETDRGEEFPIFTDFWLGKPEPGADAVTVYAILDSVSVAGAYRFVVKPGGSTVVDVEAELYFRKLPKTLGVAPLTSMFWFGENTDHKPSDYRQEVHDSDGLFLATDAETVWRPLSTGTGIRHSILAVKKLRGFGLQQRDRRYDHYEDIFNFYHQTPSVYIEPVGDWGEGEVRLVELETKDEYLDNIVAFWNPKVRPEPLKPWRFAYRMHWGLDAGADLAPDGVRSTRVGVDIHDPKIRQFAIDFDGPGLQALTEASPPQCVPSCSENAHIAGVQVVKHPFATGWRVMLKLAPKPGNESPVDVRCSLTHEGKQIGETWTYLWSPPPVEKKPTPPKPAEPAPKPAEAKPAEAKGEAPRPAAAGEPKKEEPAPPPPAPPAPAAAPAPVPAPAAK